MNYSRKFHPSTIRTEADTEANVVVAVAGVVVVAVGRTQVRTCIVPGAAPIDTVGARCLVLHPNLLFIIL
ncbi:MAG: hypothetical protein P8M67_03195 [Opitutales bacterium]|nr:hypothetical protein [Opitutales bacterium]